MKQRIFVNPGGSYFGSGEAYIETLLGSCVAIIVWHPEKKIGGLCHYLLPGRTRQSARATALDGRYGDEALMQMLNQIQRTGTNLKDYVVKVFGGGRILDLPAASIRVGDENVRFALEILKAQGVIVTSQDITGDGYRYIRFDLFTGDVWVRRGHAHLDEEE
jgi:chemotaxis protein CheD